MFFQHRPGNEAVLVATAGSQVTVSDVRARAEQLRSGFGGHRGLTFLMCDNSLASACDFLALLEADLPVALIDSNLDRDLLAGLLATYQPDLLLAGADQSPSWRKVDDRTWRIDSVPAELHAELSVLLTTSGSTGSPKFVRLSRPNIKANAEQIAASLGLRASDRGVTSLPIFYSFGMSVLTSHAIVGSSVLVTDSGMLDPTFWSDLDAAKVTHLSGVPQSFAMLRRLRFEEKALPHLRALLQAGGRLQDDSVGHFDKVMKARGGEFFVMYGQTEASPRMACLPPERLPEKIGACGVALKGARFTIEDEGNPVAPGTPGEVVYTGPNVMMGYATSRADLRLGDVQGPTLYTGDLGYLDDDGFLFLTGRQKRIAKLAGARVSLDEIEALASDLGPVAAVDAGDTGVVLFATDANEDQARGVGRSLARRLRVAAKLISVRIIDQLPQLPNGKVDYAALQQIAAEGGTRGS